MELANIELQCTTSSAVLTKVDHCSQEGIIQFNNENSDKTFVSSNDPVDTVETTSTAATISDPTVTTGNATITDDSTCPIKKYSSHNIICLAFVILFVITIVLMPTILYYTTSPQEGSFLDDVNFQNCSVST